ncbi:acetyl-CoA synthetase-like protein [Athelia psychrophila]|uniref:Acetyl-CoA synthetase-like protein n=1 Tax=Athelia psychrophila TaxID=1759441 RepID=A0A165XJL9_9AGAM|nr:acetyl-CoA synthetase-like protein [Fibularhizoctonia sp. CBS 109695]
MALAAKAREYHSLYPSVAFPECSVWHMVFENPNAPRDDKVVFVDGITHKEMQSCRFGELRTLSKRLAYGLLHRTSLGQDDVILAFSPNAFLYPAFVQATQAANLCVTLANASYLVSELTHHIRDSGAKVLVVGQGVLPIALEAAAECGIPRTDVYVLEDDYVGEQKSVWSLMGPEALEPKQLSPAEARQRTAFMCYSSGTTGRAKGVESTHFNITSVILQTIASEPRAYTRRERWLAILPLYHIYGAMFFMFLSPYCSAITYILPKFDPIIWLSTIEKHQITSAHIVPPIALFLAQHPLVTKYNLRSVGSWGSGAAPLSLEIATRVAERTGVPVRSGYGMSETTCVVSGAPGANAKPGTVGGLVPNLQARLVPVSEKDLVENGGDGRGELWLRGPQIMKGYWRNPAADRDAFGDDQEGMGQDRWMRTGDVCVFDEDGDMFVVDRVKELIKYKGFQVPPADLEDLLSKHPDVADVAVIGVELKEQATEAPRAYIVAKPHAHAPTLHAALAGWVASRVADHKKLRGGVRIVDSIPKSESGKILRKVLREQAKAEDLAAGAKAKL